MHLMVSAIDIGGKWKLVMNKNCLTFDLEPNPNPIKEFSLKDRAQRNRDCRSKSELNVEKTDPLQSSSTTNPEKLNKKFLVCLKNQKLFLTENVLIFKTLDSNLQTYFLSASCNN